MKNKWKYLIFTLLATSYHGQENKVELKNSENIFYNIFPNEKIKAYKIISKKYANEKIIKAEGDFFHLPKFSGIKFHKADEQYYYIAYQKDKEVEYITDITKIPEFLGNINSPQEAVLIAMNKGYFPDFEHNHFAGNYETKKGEYQIELSKVTSENCPYAKNNFLISINANTQEVKELKDISRYFVIYDKDCTNHPRTLEVEQQIEATKRKKEEQIKLQKEINLKMEKRIRKIQRKHNK